MEFLQGNWHAKNQDVFNSTILFLTENLVGEKQKVFKLFSLFDKVKTKVKDSTKD